MKKKYTSPELEVIRFTLRDAVLGSPTDSVSELEHDDRNNEPDDLGGLFNP